MSTKWRRNEPYNVVSILFWYSCNVLAFHTTFYIDQQRPCQERDWTYYKYVTTSQTKL